jgi:hypothetical protein
MRDLGARSVNALSASCGRVQAGSLRLPAWQNSHNPAVVSEKDWKLFENFARQYPEKDLVLDYF